MQSISLIVAGLAVGVGLTAGGYLAGEQIKQSRLGDRTVVVKGLAERPVEADLAIWAMRFVAAGNDLVSVRADLKRQAAAVETFLDSTAVSAEERRVSSVTVQDVLATPYPPQNFENRYIMSETITVRSTDTAKIEAAATRTGDLIEAGVLLSTDAGPMDPVYAFNGINDIKAEMIAEATARAREAAAQFATDSGAKLGAIKDANQGVIQILPRDNTPGAYEHQQREKVVRVVSTVTYFLAD